MSQDLNRFFQAEAEDLVSRILSALEKLEQEPVSAETLRELRRWAHTLKGAAQVVRREPIADAAHRLETMLDHLADPPNEGHALEHALAIVGEIRQMLALTAPMSSEPVAAAQLPAEPAHQVADVLRIELRDLDRLLQAVNESAIVASGLRRLIGPLERAKSLASMIRAESTGLHAERRAQNTEILADEIEGVVSEIRREIDTLSDLMQREVEELRSRTENLRMIRADTIVPALEQSTRIAAAGSGKLVIFQSAGGDLELDAHLLIALRDALIQLVRNAVAHGIEGPERRTAQGKLAAGQVEVRFRRDGSRNVVEVQDDGSGIDFDSLRSQAVQRGWLTSAQAREASAAQLTEFLLRPGVTTASAASVLAGRGVGLDVVSSTVARLKGEMRITATPGQGTTFTISVPATLNSGAVLVVNAGGMSFGIPRDAIRRTESLRGLQRLADRYVLDGQPLPMAPLAELVGRDATETSIVVEIAAQPQPFLLGVDGIVGIRQTVIYTLPPYLKTEPFVLGASIDSAGHVLPILDPAQLAPRIVEFLGRRHEVSPKRAKALPILVVDDSLTTRMLEQSVFEMEGYTVDLASSAEEALSLASKHSYGLFVVDVEMPGMDGIAFVTKTRQDPILREIPAILVTFRGSAEDKERGLKAGAKEYIVKSEFDQHYLLDRVRELIRSS